MKHSYLQPYPKCFDTDLLYTKDSNKTAVIKTFYTDLRYIKDSN
jgi:hypothetical protein